MESEEDVEIDRALELMMEGYYKEAIDHLEIALKKNPDNYEIWFYLGNAYYAIGEYKRAKSSYLKVLSLNPSFPEVYLSLANLYVRMGNLKRARRVIRAGLKKFKNENFQYLSAVALVNAEDYNLAEKVLRELMKKGAKDLHFVVLGNIYFGRGEKEKALEFYDRALEENPENVEAWNNKGFLLFTLGLYEEALKCYDRALEIDPSYREAWYNRGYTHHAMGQLSAAVADYWHALRIDSRDEIAWNNMGNALYNLKHYMESIPYFMKSVSVNPNYEIAWNNIGNALDRMHMHKYSIPFHEKALSINPKFDYAWHAKGHALCELGKYEEALECLENAIDLDPDYGETWYWRGLALYKLERYEEAIESLKIAMERDTTLVKAPELIGDIYDFLGYSAESVKYYEIALNRGNAEDRARIYIKMGRYEEALRYGDESIKARILFKLGRYDEILNMKGGAEVAYYKCLSLESMGKFKDAHEVIKNMSGSVFERERKFIKYVLEDEHFEMDPNDVDFQLRIGALLLDTEKYDKAIDIFKGIRSREAYYFMGEAYLALGKMREAKRCFEISAGMGSEMALERLEEVSTNEKVSSKKEEGKGNKK